MDCTDRERRIIVQLFILVYVCCVFLQIYRADIFLGVCTTKARGHFVKEYSTGSNRYEYLYRYVLFYSRIKTAEYVVDVPVHFYYGRSFYRLK